MSNIVQTTYGKVRGKTSLNFDGKSYHAFTGVPYAKPPLGILRFKAPQPPEPWNDILDATEEVKECYARHMFTQEIIGSEDCLYLNVFTPDLPSEGQTVLKPVLFWIHGGAYMYGSCRTDLYGPEFLLAENVVLVSINYRLGVLGFLCLEDPSLGVPGNAGMKDMIMALRWVKDNIAQFGGDPNNVTVFGESAGGSSVHYLMLSPLAKGLFHKGIAQSGCVLNVWAKGESTAQKLARVLKYNTTNEKEILKRLREASVSDLLSAQDRLLAELGELGELGIHKPVVEKPSNEPAFLLDDTMKVIESGNYNHVPVIFSYTQDEGMVGDILKTLRGEQLTPLKTLEEMIPRGLGIDDSLEIVKRKELVKRIMSFYFGDEEPSMDNKEKEYTFLTDSLIVRDVLTAVREHAKITKAPIYLGRITLDTKLNLFKRLANFPAKGTAHGDDLGYLFKTIVTPEISPGSPEEVGMRRVVKLWTTFARTGNPNPFPREPLIDVEWKPVTRDNLNCLDIGEKLLIGVNPDATRHAFWEHLLKAFSSKL